MKLDLDRNALEDVRAALADRIREGLREDGREVRALPAWLPRPRPGIEGSAVVVDTGGTNMRTALVHVGAELRVEAGPLEEAVPTGRDGRAVTAREFFDAQAGLVARLKPPGSCPVGYCFSYPAEITPDADARLLKWTKGVDIPEVVGTLVGHDLAAAMERQGVRPGGLRVLNDTVAAMLAGAGQRAGSGIDEFVGLICGTGTNMSGIFRLSSIPKLEGVSWDHDDMSVNLESGNFCPPHLTAWDDEVDAMDHPGHQRFEKAVSGYYLPFVYARAAGDEGFDPTKGSAQLVEMRATSELADAVLRRSADLVAAGLAAVVDVYGTAGRVGIVAEGSLYWGDPQYDGRVQATLGALLDGKASFEILHLPEANLYGSAYAALM